MKKHFFDKCQVKDVDQYPRLVPRTNIVSSDQNILANLMRNVTVLTDCVSK